MKRNFTLVELLITIAIIAILAAMILPSLAKARAKGESANCTGNLRQVGMSVLQYAGDNDDILVPVDYDQGAWQWTVALMGKDDGRVKNGNYISISSFRCLSVRAVPDMTATVGVGAEWIKRGWWKKNPHYGMNWGGIGRRPGAMSMIKLAVIRSPSLKSFICDTAMMTASGGVKSNEGGSYRWDPNYTGGNWPGTNFTAFGLPVGRHDNRVNILHCDGSVGSAQLLVEDSCSVDPFRKNTSYTTWNK